MAKGKKVKPPAKPWTVVPNPKHDKDVENLPPAGGAVFQPLHLFSLRARGFFLVGVSEHSSREGELSESLAIANRKPGATNPPRN